MALNLLAQRDDVDASGSPRSVSPVEVSRAAALAATADGLKATVVAGMMATYEALLARNVVPHTWMLFPAGLAQAGELPDLAACAAPAPLLVLYALGDPLFTEKGMRDADARIKGIYARADAAEKYRGVFYPGHAPVRRGNAGGGVRVAEGGDGGSGGTIGSTATNC